MHLERLEHGRVTGSRDNQIRMGSSGGLSGACWGRPWDFLEASCGSPGHFFGSCIIRRCCFLLFEGLVADIGLHN